jgi:hypothetical protein
MGLHRLLTFRESKSQRGLGQFRELHGLLNFRECKPQRGLGDCMDSSIKESVSHRGA